MRSHSEAYLDQLRAVFGALSSWGYEACLGYGTLLGAVREGNFIAHDDDVDVIYRMAGGAGWGAAVREQETLAHRFREMGYIVVSQAPSSLNMHIIDADTRAMVDLFPSWDEGGMSHLHMQKMKIESIASDTLWPTSTLAFLGENLPVPQRPEEFLEVRYGAQWRSPDQFFEWPWRLQESPEKSS
ncbi:MAG: LicD family protein [Pseudoxanthomonas sp.]|nr:LicD family protein [Pseudoxanthomonas sp.]